MTHEERLNYIKFIDTSIFGWIQKVSNDWKVSHTQVNRWVKKYAKEKWENRKINKKRNITSNKMSDEIKQKISSSNNGKISVKQIKITKCEICDEKFEYEFIGVNRRFCDNHLKSSKERICIICQNEYVGMAKTCSSECSRKYQSEIRLKSIANGLIINFGGRCKKIWYDSPIAGRICCDGNWELNFVKWCEKYDIKFNRNKIGFKYYRHDKEREASYFPDYCINDNIYVEIKGYETDLDRDKWNQFPFKLIVLKKKDIKNLNNLSSLQELLDFDNGNAYLGS